MQAVFASEQPAENYRKTDIRYLQLLHASIPNKQRKNPEKIFAWHYVTAVCLLFCIELTIF
jgi:hypothetical protein